ncbi:MAG: carbamoyl-phosphate synthase large subunit [Chloroflexota bacterium]|nr:carbamoyl-phosphate synthase large subunit [Chloroflexota bacterium]
MILGPSARNSGEPRARNTGGAVLIIGSGPIVIGQAAEFDYSGTQACLACRDAGVPTILVNSNPATIQTDPEVADTVYIEPLTVESLEAIIARERPEGLIATVGGQTALNLAVALSSPAGVLARYGVRLLGTGLEAIRRGEDRALFASTLREAGQPVLPSAAVTSLEAALEAAQSIGYPVMCRSAYALGGAGSGFARDPVELRRQLEAGLRSSGSGQVLIERSVSGWAEIEYEVIRDAQDNCLIVCNMENLDPMGVHTGDSIVVAPSQTLDDDEYHVLRAAAIQVVRSLGVEGACNVQFALDRVSGQYYVIEVNPRLSRSSALASKATGYPIAKVATRIALGETLPRIRNDITGTSAFFEPALDYVTVKIPRWPFDKLTDVPKTIGTGMRSTGEVMAIGRTFEEAMAKALRSLDGKTEGRSSSGIATADDLARRLREPNGERLPAILTALRNGWEPKRVAELTGMHPWFVERLSTIGCSGQIDPGREVAPPISYKMVDTCAAEFEARTPYFYGTALPGQNEAEPLLGPKALILGAGPIRIGQGIEFDYATVHACHALDDCGVRSIIVNNTPETVSTDYSTSDRLYFEPLDVEAVLAVVRNEREGDPEGFLGVIPQFGGQTAINLVAALHEHGVPILGTSPDAIDDAEDRAKTSAILGTMGIAAPHWRSVGCWEELPAAAAAVGFPALLRPSYVLSGAGMTIVRSRQDVEQYLERHRGNPLRRPLLVDHFLEGAMELNVDAVSDGRDVVTVVMEQLDECGIHSGDSWEVYPPRTVDADTLVAVEETTRRLARAFGVVGLMNVQFALHAGTLYVLEVNPRASRSIPFASKASGVRLADLAVRVILGARLRDLDVPSPLTDRVSVKSVVFPFRTFPARAPVLGPEMQSTGEAMGRGRSFGEAYWKAWLGAGAKMLPFGHAVYLAAPAPDPDLARLAASLEAAGCRVLADPAMRLGLPVPPDELDLSEVAALAVLDRSPGALTLLSRAVVAGIPAVTTRGGLRALATALAEGKPLLDVEPLGGDVEPEPERQSA